MTLSGNAGGGQGTGANPPAPQVGTQNQNPQPSPQPTEEYKEIQRQWQRDKNRVKELETKLAQYQGDLSAEEKLAEAQSKIAELERENALNKVLRDADPEVRELVEKFVEKSGQVPDEEFVALLTEKVKRETPNPQTTPQQPQNQSQPQESSGLRNNAPQQQITKDQEVDDFLKTVRLDDLQ